MIPHVNGLYSVAGHSQHRANIAKGKLTVCELHRVLGHVSQSAVLDAVKKGLIEGVKLDSTLQPEFCDACTQAKASRQPFPAETKNRARTYGELVHTDLWGPAQTTSISGYLYYISFTDDYSRETKVQFLKQKSEALTVFRHYEANLARQNPGTRLRKLRSDRGGEYLSAEFDQYLKDQGIERQLTVHHSPQQNGVAERLNRTLVEHARAMLLARELPKYLWAEAINYATWLKNRLPSRAIPGHTPYDLIHKTKPNLAQAHEFGAKVYVHQQDSGKLEARAVEAVFVGVDDQSKGYRIYWPGKRWVSVERNVSFVPQTVTVADDVPDEGESAPPPVAPVAPSTTTGVQDVVPPAASEKSTPSTPPRVPLQLPIPPTPRVTRIRPPPGFYRSLNQGETASIAIMNLLEASELDLTDEDSITNQLKLTSPPNHIHSAFATAEPEPTLQQALNGPDAVEWQEAIDYEISQLEKLGAWEIVDAPKNANIIPCHYVLATKRGPDGEKLKL